MANSYSPIARRGGILEQEIEKEVLLYDLRANKAYCLNETTAEVYRLCDGRVTVTEMSRQLSIKLKTIVTEDFVLVALDELMQNGLLEDGTERATLFGNVTRREMIRRSGLATMAALPIVTALSAPKAVQAASGCGIPCTSATQCSAPCLCAGQGTCLGTTPCAFIGASCLASGTCLPGGPATCSVPGGVCPPGAANGTPCNADGVCNGGICSVPGGVCAPGAATCTSAGTCTGGTPATCSIPGGVCDPGATACIVSGTCAGQGTCQEII